MADVVEIRDAALTLLDKIRQGHNQTHSYIETLKQNKRGVFHCLFPAEEDENPDGEIIIVDITQEFLPAACTKGDLQTVELLMTLGVDVTKPGEKVGALFEIHSVTYNNT